LIKISFCVFFYQIVSIRRIRHQKKDKESMNLKHMNHAVMLN